MKFAIAIAFTILLSTQAMAQKKSIKQSKPFQNVLLSLQTESVSLFVESFTDRIVGDEKDSQVWLDRIKEGHEKMTQRFGNYELSDFTYKFDKEKSKLVIFYKGEEQFKMKVIKEDGKWKLDEK